MFPGWSYGEDQIVLFDDDVTNTEDATCGSHGRTRMMTMNLTTYCNLNT
uniref:Uncharacterized protein n=1 Tax=Triticum urartu TaxID=4572 RepID=A0A8R7QR68_TRIUA